MKNVLSHANLSVISFKCIPQNCSYGSTTITTTTTFYRPLNFVQDYLDEPVPER